MGGKSSKDRLDRNTPIRQSQKQRFGVIKRKCDSLSKQLKKFQQKPGSQDAYDYLEKEILGVQNMLQEVSPDLKDKFRKAFDDYVSKCDTFLNDLETFRSALKSNTENVGLEDKSSLIPDNNVEVVPQSPVSKTQTSVPQSPLPDVPNTPISEASFSLDDPLSSSTVERRKKKLRKSKQDTYNRRISMEEKSFQTIDKMRVEMSTLRDEVLVFKGNRNDQVFHFLKESFLRFISRLEEVEIYDNRQIKYERRVAIAFARDSISALEELADGNDLDRVRRSLIMHDQLSRIQCVSQDNLIENTKVEEVPKEASQEVVSSDEGPEKEVNMRDFKKLLDLKLGRMSRMNVVTVNMIKRRESEEANGISSDQCDGDMSKKINEWEIAEPQLGGRGTNIDQSDGESSGDDIDNILHGLSVSTECLSPTFKVTSI